MGSSWRRQARIGVIHTMMFPDSAGDPSRILETSRQILLDDFFGVLFIGRLPEDGKRALKAMADEALVSLGIGAAPVILGNKLNLASLDEAVRRAAVDALKPSVDDAYELGAQLVEVLDGARTFPGPNLEQQAAEQLATTLIELCRYSEQRAEGRAPVWICLETFDRAVEKHSLVGPAGLAVQVAARVRAEQANFGITIDMGHLPLLGEGYFGALDAVKEFLVHLHLGSCVKNDASHPSYGDSHPPFGMSGGVAGVAELREFLTAAHKVGYFEKTLPTGIPWLTFEVKPQPGQSSDLALANSKRAFKEAWAGL